MNDRLFSLNQWVILLLIGVATLGCATRRTMVILIPDKNGHVGSAEVSSNGVSRILSVAGHAVIVGGPSSTPKLVDKIDNLETQRVFADALAAQPPEPKKFNLYFESGTTRLNSESLGLISQIVDCIRIRQSLDISVNGHTDRVGTDTFNQDLSLQRAKMIQKLLLKAGIDPNTLQAASHGEGNPLIRTRDNVPEPRNRRVEVIVR